MRANLVKFKIIRKDSPYNKSIKWFKESYREDGSLLSSFGYKTEAEARKPMKPNSQIFIGGEEIFTIYEEIK